MGPPRRSEAPSPARLRPKYGAQGAFLEVFDGRVLPPKPRHSLKIRLQEAAEVGGGGGAAAPLESPSPLLNTFLSHGYLIVSQGEKGERSANKRCLNKLAGGHVFQTAGIVPGRQAPTGREPPEELV